MILSAQKRPVLSVRSQERSSQVLRAAPEAKKKAGKGPSGIRFDGTMLRWVRDDRIGELPKDSVVIETKTGSSYTIWPVVHTLLTEKRLKSVTPSEALKMQSQGWTLVDVRIAGDYDALHAAGAINIPLFRFVQGNSFWDNVKKFAMASFAMKATERDPDYAGTVASTLKKGQKIMLMCAIGGTLGTRLMLRPDKYPKGIDDPDRNFGRESRCLKAAYELMQNGWNSGNLVFVEGGFQQWKYQDLPLE
jgi:rhodanese-related sulfurtransferase